MKKTEINDKIWQLPENLNMYIITGDECNCKCKYCIGCIKKGIYKEKISDANYYKRLSKVLKILGSKIKSITILGGEPTISPRLINILRIIKKHPSKQVMTSNGIMLKDIKFLNKINKSNLVHVNISRHDKNDEKNQGLFQNKNSPTEVELKKIIKSLKQKVRINCCLIKEHVDNLNELIAFLDFCKKVGAKDVLISQLSSITKEYIAEEHIIKFCNSNKVLIDPIIKEMKKHPQFHFVKEVKFDFKTENDFTYKGLNIRTRKTDSTLKEKLLVRNKNKLYDLKFHPNGILSGSRDPKKMIVL